MGIHGCQRHGQVHKRQSEAMPGLQRPSTACVVVGVGLMFFLAGVLVEVALLGSMEQRRPAGAEASSLQQLRQLPASAESLMSIAGSSAVSVSAPLAFTSRTSVPHVVAAWRRGLLDWHDLIPKHNSRWERFGTPKTEGKLSLLVRKEEQVTDFLTQFHESGLASRYGHDHGKLIDYSGCDVFQSACIVHQRDQCNVNQLCAWNDAHGVCEDVSVDAPQSNSQHQCARPMSINAMGSIEPVSDPSTCSVWIDQPVLVVHLDSESQAMYYHFYATWTSINTYWISELHRSRAVHYFIPQINDPMFFHYFGIISDFCWRRTANQLPAQACYCDVKSLYAQQQRVNEREVALNVIKYLDLETLQPPANKLKIGLISRRRKRFILNEYELVEYAQAMGFDVEILPLETMTLYEQMRAFRSLDVLVGIHGSALDNSVFLNDGAVLVQLLPFSVEHRVTFAASARASKVVYQEWQLKDRTKAVFHWDLLQQANKEKYERFTKEQILAQGQSAADNRETLMFWINQDIIVPLDEWETILKTAAKASPASQRGVSLAF